jgi:oligopeptide/dipeptide ABC transporter ATP-binding protein
MEKQDSVLLQVENLKTYFFTKRGIAKVLDGISLHINKGETLGLVGESGCGKTMTGLSLMRLVPEPGGKIIDGKIIFEGQDLLQKSHAEMRQIRGSKISMILQDPQTSLNPGFSIGNQVGEALYLHQKIRGKTLWQKVIEALRMVRISAPEARLKDFPHQLSGGMRQRVIGAIALSCLPSLLIADEPTTSLDVTIQAQYLKLLKEIQQQTQFSLLFITHDFGIVAKMCDVVAVMYAGKILESANVRDIFNRPLHPYTKALMNCLPDGGGTLKKLTTIKGQPPELYDPPPGCRFANRCPEVGEKCKREHPPEITLNSNHFISCWHAN